MVLSCTVNPNGAKRAAKRANELTKSSDAAILDTVARVYYEMGDVHAAIESAAAH